MTPSTPLDDASGASDLPGSQDASAKAAQSGWRVKVYLLSEEAEEWLEIGTGFASVAEVDKLGGPSIQVICEDTARPLMRVAVRAAAEYSHSQESIITWTEPDKGSNTELALSFQEPEGCCSVRDGIRDAQKLVCSKEAERERRAQAQHAAASSRMGNAEVDELIRDVGVDVDCPAMGNIAANENGEIGNEKEEDVADVTLDICSSTLADLRLKLTQNPGSHAMREALSARLLENSGAKLYELLVIFEDAEDLENLEVLRELVGVFRAIAGLSDPRIIDMLLSDSFFNKVAGIFEYDPALKDSGSGGFRSFLESCKIKMVLPIRDEKVVQKIHQNFRINFFKDVLLRPMMDDKCRLVLDSLKFYNNTEIVQCLLQQDRSFMRRLFNILDGAEDEEPQQNGFAEHSPSHSTREGKVRERQDEEGEEGDAVSHAKATVMRRQAREERRKDAMGLTRELFDIIKMLEPPMRESVMRTIFEDVPFFASLAKVLRQKESVYQSFDEETGSVCGDGAEAARVKGETAAKVNGEASAEYPGEQHREISCYTGEQFGCAVDRHNALDVLSTTLLHDPRLFRRHTLDEASRNLVPEPLRISNAKDKNSYQRFSGRFEGASVIPVSGPDAPANVSSTLFWVVRSLTAESSIGCVLEATDALKIILEIRMDDMERDAFLDSWYKDYIGWLCEPLVRFEMPSPVMMETEAESEEAKEQLDQRRRALGRVGSEALNSVIEICCQCLSQHKFRFKYNAIKMGVVRAVVNILLLGDSVLQLTCLRFIRSCLTLADEWLNRQLVKLGAVKAMMLVLRANHSKDNLIRSSLADIATALLDSCPSGTGAVYDAYNEHRDLLQSVQGLRSFDALLSKYDAAHPEKMSVCHRRVVDTGNTKATGMSALGEYDDSDEEEAKPNDSKPCPDGPQGAGVTAVDKGIAPVALTGKRAPTSNEIQSDAKRAKTNEE